VKNTKIQPKVRTLKIKIGQTELSFIEKSYSKA
jgi:hypothetical protein